MTGQQLLKAGSPTHYTRRNEKTKKKGKRELMSTGFYNITEKVWRSKAVYAIIREQLTVPTCTEA